MDGTSRLVSEGVSVCIEWRSGREYVCSGDVDVVSI